jgi:hypothetical protein
MRTRKVLLSCGLALGIAAGAVAWSLNEGLASANYATEAGECGILVYCPNSTSTCTTTDNNQDAVEVSSSGYKSGDNQCGVATNGTNLSYCGPYTDTGVKCP